MEKQEEKPKDIDTKINSQSERQSNNWFLLIITILITSILVIGIFLIISYTSDIDLNSSDEKYLMTPETFEYISSLGHQTGNVDAEVSILEFSDFMCPYCQTYWAGPLRTINQEFVDTGLANYSFIHMAILGDQSIRAALASECASEHSKFFPYRDALNQKLHLKRLKLDDANGEQVNTQLLIDIALDLEIPEEQFSSCLISLKYIEKINEAREQAVSYGVAGTPTILVNGRLLLKPLNTDEFRKMILDELNSN